MRRSDLDRGAAIGIWLVMAAFATTMLLAVVVDGGGSLVAKRKAQRTAEQAARVASDQITVEAARSGGSEIDPNAASIAVREYLNETDANGSLEVVGDTAQVTVVIHYDTAFLSTFGVNQISVDATASAQSIDADDESAAWSQVDN